MTKIIVIKSLEYSSTGILTKKDQKKLLSRVSRYLQKEDGIVEIATPYESKMPAAYQTGRIIAEAFGVHMWQENDLNLSFSLYAHECMNKNGDCNLLSYALQNFPELLHKNVIQFTWLFEKLKFADKTFILISEKPELSALLYYLLLADLREKEATLQLREPAFAPSEGFVIDLHDDSLYLPDRYKDYHIPFHEESLEDIFEMVWERYLQKT